MFWKYSYICTMYLLVEMYPYLWNYECALRHRDYQLKLLAKKTHV